MIHQGTGVHYDAVIFIFFTFLGMFTLSSLPYDPSIQKMYLKNSF
jgi:hypothetical protein